MDLAEFYKILRSRYPWYLWEMDNEGAIRATLGPKEDRYCPITAVAQEVLDIRYSLYQAAEAALELGLLKEEIEGIIYAADNEVHPWCRPSYRLLKEIGIFV